MIMVFVTLVKNDDISRGFFSFLQSFDFLGCKGCKSIKNSPKWKKILSVMLHVSVTLHHRFLSKHFCLQPFFAKDSVSLLHTYLTIFMRWSNGGHQRENFRSLGLQIAAKFISNTVSDFRSIAWTSFICNGNDFSWNFWVLSFCYRLLVIEKCLEKCLYHMIAIYGTHV